VKQMLELSSDHFKADMFHEVETKITENQKQLSNIMDRYKK
jgi:hypothetical protein